MSGFLELLVRQAAPWQRLVADSAPLSMALLFAHLGGLVTAGGLALSADRATWRLPRPSPEAGARHLAELAGTHRPVLVALTVTLLSGALLALADIEVFATSRVFWAKLALVVLLLANGLLLTRVERAMHVTAAGDPVAEARLSLLWQRRRIGAVVSALLWYAVVLAGVVLSSM